MTRNPTTRKGASALLLNYCFFHKSHKIVNLERSSQDAHFYSKPLILEILFCKSEKTICKTVKIELHFMKFCLTNADQVEQHIITQKEVTT